jgi:hypothetical protein
MFDGTKVVASTEDSAIGQYTRKFTAGWPLLTVTFLDRDGDDGDVTVVGFAVGLSTTVNVPETSKNAEEALGKSFHGNIIQNGEWYAGARVFCLPVFVEVLEPTITSKGRGVYKLETQFLCNLDGRHPVHAGKKIQYLGCLRESYRPGDPNIYVAMEPKLLG